MMWSTAGKRTSMIRVGLTGPTTQRNDGTVWKLLVTIICVYYIYIYMYLDCCFDPRNQVNNQRFSQVWETATSKSTIYQWVFLQKLLLDKAAMFRFLDPPPWCPLNSASSFKWLRPELSEPKCRESRSRIHSIDEQAGPQENGDLTTRKMVIFHGDLNGKFHGMIMGFTPWWTNRKLLKMAQSK